MQIDTHAEWQSQQLRYSSPAGTVTGPGRARVLVNSEIEIEIQIAERFHIDDFPEPGRVEGTLASGESFVGHQAVVSRSDWEPPKITLKPRAIDVVAQARPADESASKLIVHLKNVRILGNAVGQVGDYEVSLEWIPDNRLHRRIGEFGATLSVISPGARPESDLAEFIDNVGRLLMLAQRNCVAGPFRQFWRGDQRTRIHAYGNGWAEDGTTPLVPIDARSILGFLAQTYPAYVRERTRWKLINLVEYYWRAAINDTMEIKFILASVLMETMKFNYAKNIAVHAQDLKANGLIRGFKRVNAGGNYSFEELVDQVASHLGYPTGQFTFIDNRNCMFHTGESAGVQTGAGSYEVTKPEWMKLMDQIDDLLLRILDYRGNVERIWRPGVAVAVP